MWTNQYDLIPNLGTNFTGSNKLGTKFQYRCFLLFLAIEQFYHIWQEGEQSMPRILPHSTRRWTKYAPNFTTFDKKAEWTSSHQCTSSRWGHSSRFGDEPKTHPPLPKVFGFFSLFSAPNFFLPTYLPLPTSPHFALTPLANFGRAWSKRVELAARSKKAEVAAKSRRAKVAVRSRKAKVVARTMHLKREPKVRGQSGSLKVSSFPSVHFFGVVFLRGVVASWHRLLLYVWEEKGDDNAPLFFSMVLLQWRRRRLDAVSSPSSLCPRRRWWRQRIVIFSMVVV